MPIINVTDSSMFEKSIKSRKNVLCLYYWNKCGHCIAFAPLWNYIASQYKDKMLILNVESQVSSQLQPKYKYMSFPTLIVFKNGEKYAEFIGDRNEKNLHNFIKKHMIPESKPKKSNLKK